MKNELERRLAALEAKTAPPPPLRVQHDIVWQGEPLPARREGVDLHVVNVIISPDSGKLVGGHFGAG